MGLESRPHLDVVERRPTGADPLGERFRLGEARVGAVPQRHQAKPGPERADPSRIAVSWSSATASSPSSGSSAMVWPRRTGRPPTMASRTAAVTSRLWISRLTASVHPALPLAPVPATWSASSAARPSAAFPGRDHPGWAVGHLGSLPGRQLHVGVVGQDEDLVGRRPTDRLQDLARARILGLSAANNRHGDLSPERCLVEVRREPFAGHNRDKYQRCPAGTLVAQGKSISLDKCFLDNANEIDTETNELTTMMNQQNANTKNLEQGSTTKQFLGENVVDTNSFMSKYVPAVVSELQTSSGFASALTDPTGKGKPINENDILTIITNGYSSQNKVYSSDQLEDVELYTKVLDDPNSTPELQSIAKSKLYSDLATIQTNAGNLAKASQLASTLSGVNPNQIGFLEMDKNTKSIPYTGLTLGETGKTITASYSYTYAAGMATATTTSPLSSNTPVYLSQASDGNTYLFVLDDSAGTSKLTIKKDTTGNQMIYNYNSMTQVTNPSPTLTNIYFQKYDSSTYNNKDINAKLSCYETDPYKGLPAVVPVDVNKGWYAAIKQTLPVGANIASYDASARVSSFTLCNVGANGIEELWHYE